MCFIGGHVRVLCCTSTIWVSLLLKLKYLKFILKCCIETFKIFYRNLEKMELPVYSVKGHSEIINAIDGVGGLGIGEGAPEIVTGSRDGELDTIA